MKITRMIWVLLASLPVFAQTVAQVPQGLRFADQVPGPSPTDQIDSTIKNCAGPGCVVVAPPTLAPGRPTTIPNNTAIWDLRDNGRLSIRTDPTSVSSGSSAAFSVRVGDPAFSGTNPPVGAPVAAYFAIDTTKLNSRTGAPFGVWGTNAVVNIARGTDSFAVGDEANVNNTGTEQYNVFSNLAKFGYRVSSGAFGRLTAAYSVDANPDAAGVFHGYACAACSGDVVYVPPPFMPWQTAQAVTGSGGSQTVATTYNLATQNGLHIGSVISVDTGSNHEDVVVVGMTAGPTAGITGIWRKNHARGVAIYPYSANRGIDFGDGVFAISSFRLGDIQKTNQSGTSARLSMTVNDSKGVERPFASFTSDDVSVQGDVGGGFRWDDPNGGLIARMNSSGLGIGRPVSSYSGLFPAARLHSYTNAPSLQLSLRLENDQAATGGPCLGYGAASSAIGETSSFKAGVCLLRNAPNGQGDLVFYNHNGNDSTDFSVNDNKFRITSKGVSNDDGGFKAIRVAAGGGAANTCPTAGRGGATCTVSVQWKTPFTDSNYTPVCQLANATAGVPSLGEVKNISGAGFIVTIIAATDAAANAQLYCIAVHDP